jgi:protein TonB
MGGFRTVINRIRPRRLGAAICFAYVFFQAGPQPSVPVRDRPSIGRFASAAYPARPNAPLPSEPLPREWREAVRSGIRSPTRTRHVNPVYPEGARQDRIEGVVVLELLIDEGGSVEDARVLRSIRLLDQAAIEAVRQWRFTPSFRHDQPVKVVLTVSVNFELRG